MRSIDGDRLPLCGWWCVVGLMIAGAGCAGGAGPASMDAGADAGLDAAELDGPLVDAAVDAPVDAPIDARRFTDGVCTAGSARTGPLDADCMYLIGTTQPGDAGRKVLVNLAVPTGFSYGFGNYGGIQAVIRPSDNRLLTWDMHSSTNCRPGSRYCMFAWTRDAVPPPGPVQVNLMISNDTVVSTPACGSQIPLFPLVFPDDGQTAYRCGGLTTSESNRLRLEGESAVFLEGGLETPIALGPDRSVLLARDTTMSVVSGATRTPVAIGAFEQVLAARWRAGVFSIALLRASKPRHVEHVTVTLTGELASIGSYDTGDFFVTWYTCKLDLAGELYCVGYHPSDDELVLRFSTEPGVGPATIYDEGDHTVQIHGGWLVTGG